MFDERKYQREWRQKNRDRLLARRRELNELNRDKLRKQDRDRYWNNIEKERKEARDRYHQNKDVINARSRVWQQSNPDIVKRMANNWAAKNRHKTAAYAARLRRDHPERTLLNAARSRAKRHGLPFNLEVADIVIPECCPVLGVKLEHAFGTKRHGPRSPSLDRIVPELGYVKGNVLVISYRANILKRDATVEELRRVYEYHRRMTALVLAA